MVPDLTDHLIENAEIGTDTWPAMVDELYHHLAKQQHHATDVAKHKAHQATTISDTILQEPPVIEPDYSSIYSSLE